MPLTHYMVAFNFYSDRNVSRPKRLIISDGAFVKRQLCAGKAFSGKGS